MSPLCGYTSEQVRAAEAPLLAAGVPLMARAAAGLAERVRLLLGTRPGGVLVLAGSGSNGGDALLAAAALAGDGREVVVAPLGRRIHAAGLARAVAAGARILPVDVAAGEVAARAAVAAVLLDGLLGTGAARGAGLRAPARQVVARVAEAIGGRVPVVAVDLPSGVDPDSGAAHPPLLRATETVTFGAVKAGLLRSPGSALAGRVRLIDVGLGPALVAMPPAVTVPTR